MKHFMLDIEFLSLMARGLIWQVGIVEFDPFGQGVDHAPLVLNMEREQQIILGRVEDADTILWTLTEGDREGYEYWQNLNRDPMALGLTSIESAHSALSNFIGDPDGAAVWVNGASCDLARMRALFAEVSLETPWKFRNEACMRTLRIILPDRGVSMMPQKNPALRAHNGGDDAVYQSLWTQGMIDQIRKNEF